MSLYNFWLIPEITQQWKLTSLENKYISETNVTKAELCCYGINIFFALVNQGIFKYFWKSNICFQKQKTAIPLY